MLLNISVHKVSAASVSILLCSQIEWCRHESVNDYKLYGMIRVDLERQSNGVLLFSFLAKFHFQNLTNLNSSSIPSRLSRPTESPLPAWSAQQSVDPDRNSVARSLDSWPQKCHLMHTIWKELQEASRDDGMLKYFLCWAGSQRTKLRRKTKQDIESLPVYVIAGYFSFRCFAKFPDPLAEQAWAPSLCYGPKVPIQVILEAPPILSNNYMICFLHPSFGGYLEGCWVLLRIPRVLRPSHGLAYFLSSYAMQNLWNIFLLRQAAALLRPPLNSRSIARAAEWERSSVNQT